MCVCVCVCAAWLKTSLTFGPFQSLTLTTRSTGSTLDTFNNFTVICNLASLRLQLHNLIWANQLLMLRELARRWLAVSKKEFGYVKVTKPPLYISSCLGLTLVSSCFLFSFYCYRYYYYHYNVFLEISWICHRWNTEIKQVYLYVFVSIVFNENLWDFCC